MVCSCGSQDCDCKGKCVCNKEFCVCVLCHLKYKNFICKECGQEYQDDPEKNMECVCNCSGATSQGENIAKSDRLYMKAEASCNISGNSAENDSEQDSQNSLDRSISQADELALSDETDSPPDKNLEIKRLTEFSYLDSPPGSDIPSIMISYYGEPALVSESSFGDVYACRRSSPVNPSVSPPSHFSVDSADAPLPTDRSVSAPDIRPSGVSPIKSSISPIRAKSTSKIDFSFTENNEEPLMQNNEEPLIQNNETGTTTSRSQRCNHPVLSHNSSSMSISPNVVAPSPSQQICEQLKRLSISDSPEKGDKSSEGPCQGLSNKKLTDSSPKE